MRPGSQGTLFLHYPCFDGLVSASIAWDFLEEAKGWNIREFQFVNYDRSPTWAETHLPTRAAVVDFLYHPDAQFWADHHPTTFLTEAHRLDYEENASRHMLLYDRASPSCAMLLFSSLEDHLSDRRRYGEMALWADRIDAAQYTSVDEAVNGSAPAMTINLSLTGPNDEAYGELMLRAMRTMSLDEVASLPNVRSRADDVRAKTQAGLRLVKDRITLESGGIAVFAVDPGEHELVNRYSAYCFFPGARYSVGMISSQADTKITAMRNPWVDFESVPLGTIFRKYGGGGHQRVASVVLPAEKETDPQQVISDIVDDIRKFDVHFELETERRTA